MIAIVKFFRDLFGINIVLEGNPVADCKNRQMIETARSALGQLRKVAVLANYDKLCADLAAANATPEDIGLTEVEMRMYCNHLTWVWADTKLMTIKCAPHREWVQEIEGIRSRLKAANLSLRTIGTTEEALGVLIREAHVQMAKDAVYYQQKGWTDPRFDTDFRGHLAAANATPEDIGTTEAQLLALQA